MSIAFTLNGKAVTHEGAGEDLLLWILRENFALTGTKYGCGIAQCGACTVHVDGLSRRACVTPVAQVAGSEVVTIEGLTRAGDDREGQAIQAAWRALDVPQCGFCQSGQIMQAVVLLRMKPDASDADIDAAMAGNICRCATYMRIRAGIKHAAANLRGPA